MRAALSALLGLVLLTGCGGFSLDDASDGGEGGAGGDLDGGLEAGPDGGGDAGPPAPTCADGVKNGDETGVDCGGPTCAACPFGEGCAAQTDCLAGACSSTSHRCEPTPVPVWEDRSSGAQPVPRFLAALAYDRKLHRTVLFGGYRTVSMNDTWVWDGAAWTMAPTPGPTPRYLHAMTYDEGLGQVLLFGGIGGDATPFSFNGVAWSPYVTGPPADSEGALAYDEHQGFSVYLGGANSIGTWELSPETWLHPMPAASPPARLQAAMTYDTTLGQTFLFGGTDANASMVLDDQWKWDGIDWTPVTTLHTPAPRYAAGFAHDPDRKLSVLFGGSSFAGALPLGDTWAFDGADWSPVGAAGPPPWLVNGLVYDTDRHRLVLSLYDSVTIAMATWELHYLAVPCEADGECGSGHCADGLCCDFACAGECETCASPGSPGRCVPVRGADDADSCSGAETCDATGACVERD